MGAFLRGSGILQLIYLVYTKLGSENGLNSILHKLYVGKLHMPGFLPTTTWNFLLDSEVFFYLIPGATERVTRLNFMFSFAVILFILL